LAATYDVPAAVASEEQIIAGSAAEPVATEAATDPVVALLAVELIIAATPEEGVPSEPA
jgi:hypothetical protein